MWIFAQAKYGKKKKIKWKNKRAKYSKKKQQAPRSIV